MKKMTMRSKNFRIAAILALALSLLIGCSQSPMESSTVADNPEPRMLARSSASPAAQLSSTNLYLEQVIPSLTGGSLFLLDVNIIVPPLAVNNDTIFSISIPDPAYFYNEFGTHGLQFNVPVTVIMSYRDADLGNVDESTIRLAWFDEYYQSWRDMPCVVDQVNKCVTGELSHFSSYGLISD